MNFLGWIKRAWKPSASLLAQEVHFFVGMLVPFMFAAYGLPSGIGAALIMVIAALKEFLFDAKVEGQSTADSLIDLFFYLLGVVVAELLLAL